MPMAPLMPTRPIPPPVLSEPGVGTMDTAAVQSAISTGIARTSLSPSGFQYYEMLVAQGIAPDEALKGARNEDAQANSNQSVGDGE